MIENEEDRIMIFQEAKPVAAGDYLGCRNPRFPPASQDSICLIKGFMKLGSAQYLKPIIIKVPEMTERLSQNFL